MNLAGKSSSVCGRQVCSSPLSQRLSPDLRICMRETVDGGKISSPLSGWKNEGLETSTANAHTEI